MSSTITSIFTNCIIAIQTQNYHILIFWKKSFEILCLGGHHDQWFTLDNQVHFTLNPMSKIKISYEYVHNLTSNHNIKQCNQCSQETPKHFSKVWISSISHYQIVNNFWTTFIHHACTNRFIISHLQSISRQILDIHLLFLSTFAPSGEDVGVK